ncbi:MAG: carboxypeptidase regulatory-like domain-containing protein [Methanomassiliicoccales archaeon]
MSFSLGLTRYFSILLVASLFLTVLIPAGTVLAEGEWAIETVDNSGSAGAYVSMATNSAGVPLISYLDTSTQTLRWAFLSGTVWTKETKNDLSSGSTSVAFDSGNNPYIAFSDQIFNVKVRYANPSFNNWRVRTVDATGNDFAQVSLAMDASGYELLSYWDMTAGDLKFAYRTASGITISTVDYGGEVGEYSSIDISSSGSVFISYYDRTNGDLKLATSTDKVSWVISTVDSVGDVGLYSSLEIDSQGRPHISYYDSTNGELRYAYLDAGSVWNFITAPSVGNEGTWTSLALDTGDKPLISFMDQGSQQLKFAKLDGAALVTSIVDPSPGCGVYSSITYSSQRDIRIAYGDAQNGFTKMATMHFDEHAPVFTNVPSEGQETVAYQYTPTFNEAVTITAYATNAPFLTWSGSGYQGTPGFEDAGTYWINITAYSVSGGLSAYQNSTFVIKDAWEPQFTNAPSDGQETVPYQFVPTFNESVTIAAQTTNATFLSWTGIGYEGTPGLEDAGSYWINISATSVTGLLTAYQNATFTILDISVGTWSPEFTSSPVTSGRELSPYEYSPTWNETVTWTFTSSAAFLQKDADRIYGTPGINDAGAYMVNVRAVSVAGRLDAWQNFTLIIGDTWAPTFDSDPVTVGRELSPYSYQPLCNESVIWTVSIPNAFLSWDGTIIAGTPGTSDAGSYAISIRAQSVSGELTAWQNFTLVIGDTWAPTFQNVPPGGRPGTHYSYAPEFNETVTITAHSTSAPFLTWDGSGYQGDPGIDDAGSYWISITALSNAGLLSATQNRTFAIGEGWAPAFENIPADGREAFPYSYFPQFNESVTITAHSTNAPFLSWTGSGYEGTPELGSAGQYWISITAASIPGVGSATQNSTFTIGASWSPNFTNSPGNGRELALYTYVPTFDESVSITAHSTTATFLTWTGAGYQGIPSLAQSGVYWINITALSVNGGLSAELHSQFTIYDSWAPMFTSVPITEGRELSLYEYEPLCNETVIWTVSQYPDFLSWDGSVLSGTPGPQDSGSYSIRISAFSPSGSLTAWQNFTLVIGDTWAPTFTNAPPNAGISLPYSYYPAFNESVTIIAHSTNANFLAWIGSGYEGTPAPDDAASYWISITAFSVDGLLSATMNSTFQVLQGWEPVFTNSPQSGLELDPYVFAPTFNESASITAYSTDAPFLNWNGTAYLGTPLLGQAGLYWINVTAISDAGRLSSWLNASFSINVLGPPVFLTEPPANPFFATLQMTYSIETSEPCAFLLISDASFLRIEGDEVVGELTEGTYFVHIRAVSLHSDLVAWQNFTMLVITDEEPPEIVIDQTIDGAFMNSTTLDLDLSSLDGDGSGNITIWSKINEEGWRSHGQVSRISLNLPQGPSLIQIKGVDRVGNEGFLNFTVHVDTIAPAVIRHSHAGSKVTPEGALSVEFSKAMDRDSVKVHVNGALADLAWNNSTVQFLPEEGWAEDTEYNVSVSGKDLYGNQLSVVSWTFRTGYLTVIASGTVQDPFGNPVVNATLSINGTVVAITDGNGSFSFELRPGMYVVVIRADGFEDLTIELTANRSVPLELSSMVEWHREIPWTIWLPLPFFLLQAVLIIMYRRRHP